MTRYAEIVASENKSLSQQVVVLNEILLQKDRENVQLKDAKVDFEMQVKCLMSEVSENQENKRNFEREKRLRTTLKESMDRLNE